MELGILHNSPPSTKRGCRAGRLHRLWHGLPPTPWPCTRSQHHSVPSRNLHPLMVLPFLQPHPDLQSAVGNAPLSSKHPAQLPTTDCLLSIISPMGGQPSDAPALSPPSPLQQGGQSSNAPALSPPSPLPQGGQPIALALSPPSPPPQGGQPSDAPGLSPSSSTLLLCPSDSTLNICHLNSQSAVKTGKPETISDYILEQKLDIMILTETWLSESGHETSCNLMTPSGFVLKSYPRASKGGGIAYHWRWLGYAYGLDLLFTLRNKVLTINRNCGSSQRFSGSLSQQETRQVMLCVKMAQIKKKEMCSVVSTGIRTLSLQADDVESLLLTLNPATKFPLQVTMHLLYLTPDPALPFPSLSVPPTPVDVVPALLPASSPPSPPPLTPAIRGSLGGGGEGVPEGGAPRQARWTQGGGGGGGGGEGTSVVSRQTDSSTQVDLHTADSSVGGESSAVSMDTDFSGASGRMPALVVTSQSSASSLSLHAAKDDSQSRAEELNSSGCVAVVGEEKDVSGNARSDPCSFCVKSSPFSSSSLQLPVAKTPPHRLSPVALAVSSMADSTSSSAEDPQSSVIADPKSSSSGDSTSSCTDPKSSSGGPRSSSIDSQSSTPDPLSSSADHPKSSRVDPRSCSTDAQPATTADPQSSSSSTSQSSVLQRPHHGDVPSCSSASCKSVDASDSGSQPSAVSTPYPATPLPRTPSQVRQVRRSARVGSRSRSYLK
ncbi:hypothetical protein ACOMHN_065677 [Nucella lapillus]